ncbi:glucose-6-phosphate 1-dehydrogenase [Arenicella chitinivorans]|uniref:Glucose-6-phosphate 1-dehydrogenase n=1 Tax=Arenicella chitinivorans TaxID=1329800 RepID=A0A918RQM0_9GAMM|nr:glucose-6-phosphate dehydrogenase [Arenicella chitinivorans]GHA05058.1 glucose-6-phosphate 1-dehydrogenase [Arenicella chitinivorans]
MLNTCNIVIVGGEGDLAFRKLYPALYSLHKESLLADCSKVVGFGRGKYTAEAFVDNMRKWTEDSDYVKGVDDETWASFADRILHFVGDATDPGDIKRLQKEMGEGEIVFYLSTPPSIFAPICKAMGEAGAVTDTTRLVVEKPLGSSRESFNEINNTLFETFEEQQIYRIDHYLGKETVQNLLALRFSNIFFEPLWNRHYIDHVQVTVAESVGAGGRWAYYDESGALRDMVQNHLLQLVCLVAMEFPSRNKADDIRDEKLKVIRSLKPIDASNVQTLTVRGQYTEGSVGQELVPGYSQEDDASGESDTETFVAIKAEIENNRWQGVPFYLRTGKRMANRYSEIVIQFKPVIFKFIDIDPNAINNNQLVIRLQPNEGVEMKLMNKVPGLSEKTTLQNVGLNLSFEEAFEDHRSPSAYERLILDVTRGDQTLFMRSDELRGAWRWVDGMIDGWKTTQQKPQKYKAGSTGPDDALGLLIKDGRKWQDYGG